MENAPVIMLHGIKPPVNSDVEERYHKWYDEVYTPIIMRDPRLLASLRYQIVNESPEYPKDLNIRYFENLEAYEEFYISPDVVNILKDVATTWPKHGREVIWEPIYQPLVSFNSNFIDFSKGKHSDDSPVLSINTYKFSIIEWGKFSMWFGDYGVKAFLPLFRAIRGLEKYECYKWTGAVRQAAKVKEYPIFMTLSYFDSLNSCQYFEASSEKLAFQSAIQAGFPIGLNSQWNVQYQLVKSFRK
jgi:hypothetical protein